MHRNLLTLNKSTFEDHLSKLRQIYLSSDRYYSFFRKRLKVDLFIEEVEYLWYKSIYKNIKPMPEKVSAVLEIISLRKTKEIQIYFMV